RVPGVRGGGPERGAGRSAVGAGRDAAAAPGGYYRSGGGDAVVADPATITGSIGVFGGKFSLRGLYEKIGVSRETLSRGRHAAIFSEARPWNDEERAKMRSLMEAFYQDFVSKAAKGRKKTYEEIHEVAQGRVWTGADAQRIGLVDKLGGLDVAIAEAKQRAKIGKDQEVSLVILPERKGFWETLMERQEEGNLESALPRDVRALLSWVSRVNGEAVIARLPFELNVR